MTKEERIEEYVDNYVILDGLDKEGIAHFKQLVKDVCTECVKNEVAELEQENAELKEKLKPEKCIEYLAKGGYVKFLCENGNEHDQLTKAKEIIKKLYAVYYDPCVTESDLKYRDELFAEIKQFISKVEK